MAVTKLSLYNDALFLLGQRQLLTDVEDRPNRHKLDHLYDNGAVDYCLEVVKPKFAAKLASLAGGAPTLTTAYSNEATLPADFQALIGVYADAAMDQPITRYTHEADKILSDFSTIFVRYVQDFATVGLTNMSHTFGRVVAAYLARELSINVDPDETANCEAQLDARIAISEAVDVDTEAPNKGTNPLVLNDGWRQIYDDALQLLGQPKLISNTDDSLRKTELDRARNSEVVEAILEDQAWQFSKESKKIFYNPAITPEFGPRFAFNAPIDMHRLDGIWADDYKRNPIREYVFEDDIFYTDYSEIYIQYVSKDYLVDPTPWPAFFKRYLAARMAVDAAPSIPGADLANAENRLVEREREGKSVDAISNPPKQFSEGSWARSRQSYFPTSNRNRP
jgi:hypothetical protein